MNKCKSISCLTPVNDHVDYCPECLDNQAVCNEVPQKMLQQIAPTGLCEEVLLTGEPPVAPTGETMAQRYPAYYKDVSDLREIDVYAVHHVFQIDDPSGCLQHSSKKLLLSGARTGGKPKWKDIKEARDTLTRWLELNGVA